LIIFQQSVPGLSEATLARFVVRAKRTLRLQGALSVLVTSSVQMQELNHRFRGKNKPTDVLSFPAMPELKMRFAGDVAISAEIATHNAKRLGHTVADEIRILALHGVLHLAGYDHENDDGKMERKEERLRKSLGLPVGLIERNGSLIRKHGAASKRIKKPVNAHGRTPSPVFPSSRMESNSCSTRASR